MSGIKTSDPLVILAIEKNREKLSAYSDELEALNISNQESHRKIDFLQKNLKSIESELQSLSEKKNSVLKELNSAKVTASLLDARAKDLNEAIEELNNSIHKMENQPAASSSKSTRKSVFLQRMDNVIPWTELNSLIEQQYSKIKTLDDEHEVSRMLRAYLLLGWFKLTPKSLEEALYDSLSMRDFVGSLSESKALPDQQAIERFVRFLGTSGLEKIVQTKVQAQLNQKGLVVLAGSIVEASVGSPGQAKAQNTAQSLSQTAVPSDQAAPQKSKQSPNPSDPTDTKAALNSGNLSVVASKPGAALMTKNKFSFFDYLITYGEPKKLLTDIVTELHALVVEKKETRHYLFNANIDNLISDQINFVSYIFPKERITQNNPIVQTAPANMRVAIGTFDEIANLLTYLLIQHFKVERKGAPTAAAHILELIEETRCQIEDTNQTVWKPIELKASLLDSFFSMKGFITRTTSPTEVALLGGLEFPLRVQIDASTRSIVIKAVCKANDWATLDDLSVLKDTLNQHVGSLDFDVSVVDQKPVLTTQYYLPYGRGVPNRLLFKVCKSFAGAIAKGFKLDQADLMVKPAS